MRSEISDRFRSLARRPEIEPGLAEGALVVAAEARPEIEIERALESIGAIVERARPLVQHASTPSAAVEALNHALFELERFRGNQDQYDDPRNSFLDEVLASRRGLPITLSVLYVEVARRLGLEAHGIGFPGHFLAKVVGVDDRPEGEIIIDPFFARTLSLSDCADRLRAAAGEDASLDQGWLRAATAREIYVRILNNLKLLFLRRGEGLTALGCFDRILVLAPDAAFEYRDRGILLERLDCILPAIQDYTRFLELAPRHESAQAIRLRRDALARRKPKLN
jgi:regulator of sirC expression with transglutaminase-like and TPR domain